MAHRLKQEKAGRPPQPLPDIDGRRWPFFVRPLPLQPYDYPPTPAAKLKRNARRKAAARVASQQAGIQAAAGESCAQCCHPGVTICCKGCRSIPATATWYCCEACQAISWPKHFYLCLHGAQTFEGVAAARILHTPRVCPYTDNDLLAKQFAEDCAQRAADRAASIAAMTAAVYPGTGEDGGGVQGRPTRPSGCARCGQIAPPYACGRCTRTPYCSKECQKQDWTRHATVCVPTTE